MKGVYLIYRDSSDDCCEFVGYITGSSDDAEAYCRELNKNAKYRWDLYTWDYIKCLDSEK